MDGFQGRLKGSLQLRLSVWLSAAILAVALVAGIFSFVTAYQEAIELQDEQLRQMAALLNRGRLPVTPDVSGEQAPDDDADAQVLVRMLPRPGSPVRETGGGLSGLPADLPDGIQTVSVGGVSWRLFVRTLDADHRVAVGQQTAIRDEIARDSGLRTVMPLLLLIPVLLALVGALTRKMFRPLRRAAEDLDRRPEHDLSPVADTDLPSEVRPFVAAINGLLRRVDESVAVQRRFLADAAHELRSPLAALSLQAERLQAADMPGQARERLEPLLKGIRRARNLIDQMLTLVRVQAAVPSGPEPVAARQVFRQVLEDLMPLAEAGGVDVGVLGQEDRLIPARGAELFILVRNLVDNAIRNTPQGGRIDLSLHDSGGEILLRIDDTGPGIPEAERGRVFDPFYRVPGSAGVGSGLGLSIVRTIAERMGARVSLDWADPLARRGLRVEIAFPA